MNASKAAASLGISVKALRLYERSGLIAPGRTAAGWRIYGPADLARARAIAALRALGLSLVEVSGLLDADVGGLDAGLARHEAKLRAEAGSIVAALGEVRRMRAGLTGQDMGGGVAFDLPWPWGGERFELRRLARISYIIGPLGSGKTRFAEALAAALPGGRFIGLEREGGDMVALLGALAGEGATPVVDMIEQGLDVAEQAALIGALRRDWPRDGHLFLMTRSLAILDLAAVGEDEAIILCPANHSPPVLVEPCVGAPGYEAVATCLASPEVRARTAGVMAVRAG